MKKTIKLLSLILVFALGFTACGAKAALDETQSLQLAQSHVRSIVKGDFDTVVADCNRDIQKQIDSAALASAWQQVVPLAGEYVALYSQEYTASNSLATVQTVVEFTNIGVVITTTYDNDGKIRGLFFNTKTIRTELTDNEVFTEQEISVGEHNIKGVLTLPDNAENYPVVVLVQGSGASDYDETIGANKPFKEIAHGLAEKGIASIRINKRFYQNPSLAPENLTVYDEYMDDIYSAIDYAKANVSRNVFVIGHSLGAMSAPKIALDNNLNGVVMLAGTIRGLEDVILDQNTALLENTDQYSKSEKERILKATQEGVDEVKALTSDSVDPVLGVPASYWLSLRDLDAENILKNQLTVPVLALQGTADFQVYMDKDFQYMQSVLADKENITFKSYDGLNHLFMPQSQPGAIDVSEYAAENHIPQYVIDDIAQFLLNN